MGGHCGKKRCMKSTRILFLCCCLLCLSVVCHAEEEIEPTPAEHYRTEGVTIALPTEWSPYSFTDASEERAGYCLEIWRLWAESTGVAVRFVFVDASDSLEGVKAGEIDILGGMLHADELDEDVAFSDALHSSRVVLAIREGGAVDCSNALAAGAVAVAQGSAADEFLTRFQPGTRRVECADLQRAVDGFLAGKADALVAAYPQLAKLGREMGVMGDLSICRTLFYREVYAGVQKEQIELLELVNDGLNEMPQEKLTAIEARWFVPSEDPKQDWLPSVIPAVIAAIGVLAVVIIWARRRRR